MNMIPRARLIHTKIWSSEDFNSLKPVERLLFIGIVTIADDEGRLKADARFLKSQIFPYDSVGVSKVEKMRDRIHSCGLIHLYKIENTVYALHPKWKDYQKLRSDRLKLSEIPPPLVGIVQPDDNQIATEEKLSEVNGIKEKEMEAPRNSLGIKKMKDAWEKAVKKIRDETHEQRSSS